MKGEGKFSVGPHALAHLADADVRSATSETMAARFGTNPVANDALNEVPDGARDLYLRRFGGYTFVDSSAVPHRRPAASSAEASDIPTR